MATLSAEPSHNPFRSNPVTPNVTGSARTPSPVPSSRTVDTPSASQEPSSIPDRTLGLDLPPDEEPPPYTVRPSTIEGETTLEQGPRRPFQPAPVLPTQLPRVQTPSSSSSYPSLGTSSRRGRRGGLIQQLTGAINEVVDSLERATLLPPPTSQAQQSGWGAYPGRAGPSQQLQPVYNAPPPPRHPAATSRSAITPPLPPRPTSSDFARDFYAAGGDVDDSILTREAGVATPSGPPPTAQPLQRQYAEQRPPKPDSPGRPSRGTAPPDVPDDGSPTTRPVVGHPLLKDGKILVYPSGYECDKCHNIGYKNSDPLRPCKRCWKKHAKPFNGPLAYSFSSPSSSPSSSSTNTDRAAPDPKFQRPLRSPPAAPPPIPTFSRSLSPPEPYGGYTPVYSGEFRRPPMHVGRPPPGSVVYTAGDPRIGGRLCWRCEGAGNVSFLLLDHMTCEVCGGIGRLL